jgi:WD40 repeat protein
MKFRLFIWTIITLITIHPTYATEHDIITRQNATQIAQLAVLDTLQIRAVAMSPSDNTLMVATETDLWAYTIPDLTATRIFTLPDEMTTVQRIGYSPDAQYITLLDNRSRFYTVDIAQRALVSTIDTYQDVLDFDYHPTQPFIALVTRSGDMGIFHALTGEQVQYGRTLSLLDLQIIRYSPTGNWIGMGTWDDLLILYEYMDETEWGADFAWLRALIFTNGFHGHAQDITAIAFSPDERYVFGGGFSRVTVWDMVNNGRVQLLSFDDWITGIVYTHDGQALIIADAMGMLWVLDSTTYDRLAQFPTNPNGIRTLFISPDGRYVVCAMYDNTAQVWGIP